ncbi:hypothetical protein CMUS01_14711 [Colletotrichum musicola]|uniref:ABC transporter n=1 Tax=Colletotrichum musicola TaxID=2175873 RepID=A0A8H6J2R3_9PEZI|nr:hypothetical protein CMUS01_14711 [Colletotrichum musicola]
MNRVPQLVSAATAAVFLLLLPFRLWRLSGEKVKVVPGYHGLPKLVLAVLLVFAQAGLVADASFLRLGDSKLQLAFAIVAFVASVGLAPLIFLEHSRSISPSDLAIAYLIISLACDAVELATNDHAHVMLMPAKYSLDLPMFANLGIKFTLLWIENRGKRAILRDEHQQHSPEELGSVLNRTFFWWINSILAKGNRSILTEESLPPLDDKLSSKLRRQRALRAWDQRSKPETKTTLPRVLAKSMLPHFLAPVIPRISLIVFRYSQPALITIAIRYLNNSSGELLTTGFSVVSMAIIVYLGLTVSRAIYLHSLNRVKMMIRGAVVGLINNQSLSHLSTGYDDAKAVTLMSTDAENVGQSAQMFHESWAHVIEVAIGAVMLARQVGWFFLVPFVMILFCSRMSRYLAKNLQAKQKAWNEATQKRLALTASMLTSMKSLKMLGVTPHTESMVQELRLQELEMARKVRWMMVAYNASANALGIFSPILTLVLYVLQASFNKTTLDAETAFTTTALLGLVTHPANMIMTIIPQAIGSLAAFQRIQEYLLQPPRSDQRQTLERKADDMTSSPAIRLDGVSLRPAPSTPGVLQDVDIDINKGSIVICSGPVGSGKTTLAKAIMGELPPASGIISVSSKRIGCCQQSPWLPSGTIKEAICAFLPEERSWYEEVVRLCCLEDDISALPNGDETQIGSRGLNLSGGQRQRVALARAVYARCEIVLLDDSFSALDGKTESQIMNNLFGVEGHFKKTRTTVFLITNSTSHFHLADFLVVLADGSITYQGTWDALAQKPEQVLKLQVSETHRENAEDKPQVDKTVQSKSLKVTEAVSDLSRATGDMTLYNYYLRSVGFRNFLLVVACTSLYSFFITFPQYWLRMWTEAPLSQTMFHVGGYLIISLIAWTSTSSAMWTTGILIAPRSGAELHRRLLSTVVGAPLSYFSTTDTGVILNRFSQDIQLVDKQLPQAMLSLLVQISKLLVQVVLLFSAQKMMSLSMPLCVIVVYIVQKMYLRTSRQLRLLDLESQSAVYSSFLESVEGVSTIRAFGWERDIEHANIRSLDKSQQPVYMLACLQQWLGVVLDLIVATIATGLIAFAVLMKGTTSAGQIGMALNIVLIANSTLFSLVTSWTNMEISLGAISRLRHLEANTPKEDKMNENYIPSGVWPSSGVVEIDNITVEYNPEALALQDVSLNISAGQQVVVCGRTGSGKSTLLLTLLRLLDAKSGSIKVDGVDLSLVPRSVVRQRCFITVGQDPFVLGQVSLRLNLDPSGSVADEAIVTALQRTSLWTHFTSAESAPPSARIGAVLDSQISSLPQMSTGQTQLFALARVILQLQFLDQTSDSSKHQFSGGGPMPVLLLDEATSSVDPKTEATMHRIVQDEFVEKGHTIITIAHRLGGVAENMRPGKDVAVLLANGNVEKVGGVEDLVSLTSQQV